MSTEHARLPDDKDAANLTKDPAANAAKQRNPIEENLHEGEPRVLGPDGSGESDEHSPQPYRGAD